MNEDRTPPELRDHVHSAIATSLRRDSDLRGARTARLLAVAGVVGVAGALGATLLISGHPFGHHPPWHVVFFTAVWSGLLVVTSAIALLQVRTPVFPLARSACVGLLGLGLAGLCGALCPEPHFVVWWLETPPGTRLVEVGGAPLAALCFGLVTTVAFGAVASFLISGSRESVRVRPILPAAMLVLLLSPGVALQAFGMPWLAFVAWWLGTAGGAYLGVASGQGLRSLLARA